MCVVRQGICEVHDKEKEMCNCSDDPIGFVYCKSRVQKQFSPLRGNDDGRRKKITIITLQIKTAQFVFEQGLQGLTRRRRKKMDLLQPLQINRSSTLLKTRHNKLLLIFKNISVTSINLKTIQKSGQKSYRYASILLDYFLVRLNEQAYKIAGFSKMRKKSLQQVRILVFSRGMLAFFLRLRFKSVCLT